MDNLPLLYLYYDNLRGLGHRSRCRAIREAWHEAGGQSLLPFSPLPSSPCVVLIDHYYAPEQWIRLLRSLGYFIVRVDERIISPDQVDLLINPTFGATQEFVGGRQANLLAGTSYYPIQNSVHRARRISRIIKDLWIDCDHLKGKMPRSPGYFYTLMALAEGVICAAGVTAYEALYLKKKLVLRIIAENQRLTYRNLIQAGWALPEDQLEDARSGQWKSPFDSGAPFLDGLGASRIVSILQRLWLTRDN